MHSASAEQSRHWVAIFAVDLAQFSCAKHLLVAQTNRYNSGMSHVTLRNIAEDLHVSIGTVSRALRGAGDISDELKSRVREAGQRLGYRRTRPAGRRRKRTNAFAVIVPDVTSPLLALAMRGILDIAFRHGFVVHLSETRGQQFRQDEYLERMLGRGIDGVIIDPVARDDGRMLQEVHDRRIPLVVFDRQGPNFEGHFVGNDNVLGGRLATEHLIREGFQRVGLVQGPLVWSICRERRQGYIQALVEAGRPFDPELVVEAEAFRAQLGLEATRQLLERQPDIDALFIMSDMLAVGALRYIQLSGRWERRRVAVVGFADIPLAEYLTVSLSTIHQEGFQLGQEACHLLVRLLENKFPPEGLLKITMPVKLVVRESSRRLATRAR